VQLVTKYRRYITYALKAPTYESTLHYIKIKYM
jgi:hypothetical protein